MEEIKKKKINGRNKGNQYERDVANLFTEVTGVKHYTNRHVSKLNDDKKVDITSEITGLNIQVKCTANNVSYSKIIPEMEALNDDDRINVIISKVTRKGSYTILRTDDFIHIIKQLKDYGKQ